MNITTITNILYAVLIIVAYTLGHFGIIPVDAVNVIVGGIGGFAVGTGTLIPKQVTTTVSTPLTGIPVQQAIPSIQNKITTPDPDLTVKLPIVRTNTPMRG